MEKVNCVSLPLFAYYTKDDGNESVKIQIPCGSDNSVTLECNLKEKPDSDIGKDVNLNLVTIIGEDVSMRQIENPSLDDVLKECNREKIDYDKWLYLLDYVASQIKEMERVLEEDQDGTFTHLKSNLAWSRIIFHHLKGMRK